MADPESPRQEVQKPQGHTDVERVQDQVQRQAGLGSGEGGRYARRHSPG